MDTSDSGYRCIGNIIAEDLRLVASRLYRMAITRPGSPAAVTLSPSLGADLLGCIHRTREMETKGKEALYNHAAYVLVRNHKFRDRLAALRVTSRWIWRPGKLHLHLTDCEGGKNPCRRHFYWTKIQKEKRIQGKQRMKQSSYVRNCTNP